MPELLKETLYDGKVLKAEDLHNIIDKAAELTSDKVTNAELTAQLDTITTAFNTKLNDYASKISVEEAISAHTTAADAKYVALTDTSYAKKEDIPTNEDGIIPVEKGGTGYSRIEKNNFLVGDDNGTLSELSSSEVRNIIEAITQGEVESLIEEAIGTAIRRAY